MILKFNPNSFSLVILISVSLFKMFLCEVHDKNAYHLHRTSTVPTGGKTIYHVTSLSKDLKPIHEALTAKSTNSQFAPHFRTKRSLLDDDEHWPLYHKPWGAYDCDGYGRATLLECMYPYLIGLKTAVGVVALKKLANLKVHKVKSVPRKTLWLLKHLLLHHHHHYHPFW